MAIQLTLAIFRADFWATFQAAFCGITVVKTTQTAVGKKFYACFLLKLHFGRVFGQRLFFGDKKILLNRQPDLDLAGGAHVDVDCVPRNPLPLSEYLFPVLRPQSELQVDFGIPVGLKDEIRVVRKTVQDLSHCPFCFFTCGKADRSSRGTTNDYLKFF